MHVQHCEQSSSHLLEYGGMQPCLDILKSVGLTAAAASTQTYRPLGGGGREVWGGGGGYQGTCSVHARCLH